MAEEAGTTTVETVDTSVDGGGEAIVETEGTETIENQDAGNEDAGKQEEGTGGTPFSKDDIEWDESLGLDDNAKTELFDKYSKLFKGKDEINTYLKELALANKTNKENQAKRVQELESGWEKELKTDPVFGKDYEGNKKKVVDTLSKYASEKEMAELNKFGFTKSPVLNRVLLKIANEFSDAKVLAGAGNSKPKQPTDRFGNTMFDFSKKQ